MRDTYAMVKPYPFSICTLFPIGARIFTRAYPGISNSCPRFSRSSSSTSVSPRSVTAIDAESTHCRIWSVCLCASCLLARAFKTLLTIILYHTYRYIAAGIDINLMRIYSNLIYDCYRSWIKPHSWSTKRNQRHLQIQQNSRKSV